MKKVGIGLLVVAGLLALPLGAAAQPEEEAPAEAEGAEEGTEGEGEAGEGEGGEGTDPVDAELPEELGGGEGGDAVGGGISDICEVDPEACPEIDFEKEAARDLNEQVYAVQQIFAIKARRFELQPYWSFTLNDQFVSHPGPGLAVNYYLTNVLAVGANFNYYRPFNSDSEFNAQHRRAARVAVPLTEYDWGAALNFTYVPAIGKFAGFGDFIFQYEAYLVGGVGAISTRPIAVIDPDNRTFDYEPKVAFNAGLGLRIFFNRWFAATLEVRDYIFNDKLENTEIAPGEAAQDEDTWLGDSSLTNNVQAQAGISIFLPFSFEYRLPK